MGQPTTFIGIDVSKDTWDACLLAPGGATRQASFPNDARGHAALLAWADRHTAGAELHFCLEATGPYSEAPAAALAEAGRRVSVANPARVKAHAAAGGQGNKTDPADARAIAEFAHDRHPPAWQPPAPEVRAASRPAGRGRGRTRRWRGRRPGRSCCPGRWRRRAP